MSVVRMNSRLFQLFSARKELLCWLLLLSIGLAGMVFMRYLTPAGMGLVNDSEAYIGGARNILAGSGYSRMIGSGGTTPITHFPPGFSILLAGIGLLGLDAIPAAHVVNVLLLGANAILAGITIRRASGSWFFALLGSTYFVLSEPLLLVHSFALSEPMYLFIGLVLFLALQRYFDTRRWYWLALASLLACLGYLTRYVGAALYITIGLALLIFLPEWKSRLRAVGLFLLFSLPGTLAWMVRNTLISGSATNRVMVWHPIDEDKLNEGLRNFWGWLLPDRSGLVKSDLPVLQVIIYVVLLVMLAGLLVRSMQFLLRKTMIVATERMGWLVVMYALVYIAVLVFSMTFVDGSTLFENRILSPFDVCVLILLCCVLAWLWKQPAAGIKIIAGAAVLMFGAVFAGDAYDTYRVLKEGGQGFASDSWVESETINAVRLLPQKTILFTNKRTALYLLANRGAFILPSKYNPVTQQPDANFDNSVQMIHKQVLEQGALVVIMNYAELLKLGDDQIPDIIQGLPLYKQYADGAIFGLPH